MKCPAVTIEFDVSSCEEGGELLLHLRVLARFSVVLASSSRFFCSASACMCLQSCSSASFFPIRSASASASP